MASSVALSSPLQCTSFEFPSLISRKSRSRVNFRRTRAGVISCDFSRVEVSFFFLFSFNIILFHIFVYISCYAFIFYQFKVSDVFYRPPGTQLNILNGVSFSLPEKNFGLIFGQSGSGKTTLLQVDYFPCVLVFFSLVEAYNLLAGLSKPTSGSIYVQRYGNDGKSNMSTEPLSTERVGIVFQFPERYFVADNVLDEVIFGWPRQSGDLQLKEYLALNLQRAINWVGLSGISLDKDPHSLSGGYKRRLALAIQLVQIPDLLILDEPLAGLDWKARADVVKLLKHLKKELTILVVSHDLKELVTLVDRSWRMDMGGVLMEEPLPV
ncbi:hypothetical protein JRO89_XSUnG0086600 [Xanthoceras sorbifolium]|uniref:ABC transporter domain-containing protein n=1 Tax=Xanthoceras sorbifolium TaxID=99658 RepID=A0ABQ8GZI4_9ROSI|nr:hypothetical protein JRO89_XSUnG0086600 [Xanthoceras sorbifolium]